MFDILLKLCVILFFVVAGYFAIIYTMHSLADGVMTDTEFFEFIAGEISLVIAYFIGRSFFRNKAKPTRKAIP